MRCMYFADVRGQRDILMAAIADAGSNGNLYSVWLTPHPAASRPPLSRKGRVDAIATGTPYPLSHPHPVTQSCKLAKLILPGRGLG